MIVVRSFDEALQVLKGKQSKKLGNNTCLKVQGERFTSEGVKEVTHIGVILHHTTIIQWNMLGGVVLSSGGWRTPTTRKRLNTFLGNRINTRNGDWWIYTHVGSSVSIPFFDGMDLHNVESVLRYRDLHNELVYAKAAMVIAGQRLYREMHKAEEFERRSAAARKGAATRKAKLALESELDDQFEEQERQLADKRAALGKEM